MSKSANHHYFEYASITDALNKCLEPLPDYQGDCKASKKDTSDKHSWSLDCHSFEDALGLANNGYKDAGKVFLEKLEACSLVVERKDIVRYWDTAGEEIDIDRFLNGEPENMRAMRFSASRRKRKTPTTEIIVDRFASCGIGADTIKRHGLFVLSLVRALQDQGHSVGVTVAFCGEGSNTGQDTCTIAVRVKQPDQYIDPDMLGFWLVHPAAFRRIGFRLIEHLPEKIGQDFGAYHYYFSPGKLPIHLTKDKIYFDNVSLNRASNWKTDQDVQDAVKKELIERGLINKDS